MKREREDLSSSSRSMVVRADGRTENPATIKGHYRRDLEANLSLGNVVSGTPHIGVRVSGTPKSGVGIT